MFSSTLIFETRVSQWARSSAIQLGWTASRLYGSVTPVLGSRCVHSQHRNVFATDPKVGLHFYSQQATPPSSSPIQVPHSVHSGWHSHLRKQLTALTQHVGWGLLRERVWHGTGIPEMEFYSYNELWVDVLGSLSLSCDLRGAVIHAIIKWLVKSWKAKPTWWEWSMWHLYSKNTSVLTDFDWTLFLKDVFTQLIRLEGSSFPCQRWSVFYLRI